MDNNTIEIKPTRSGNQEVVLVANEAKPVGGCCAVLSQEERDRNFANGIRGRADQFAQAENFVAARSMLAAAGTLLDSSGGRENDEGLWVLASEANMLGGEEKYAQAEALLNQALKLAISLYGEVHPCTGVCYSNVGKAVGEQSRYDEALALVEKGLGILEAAAPIGAYTAAYIDGICTHARQLKSKFSHTDKTS